MQRVRQKITCNRCGGSRLLFDSYAKWDVEAQEYSIVSVFDKPVLCEDCDKAVNVNWNEEVME